MNASLRPGAGVVLLPGHAAPRHTDEPVTAAGRYARGGDPRVPSGRSSPWLCLLQSMQQRQDWRHGGAGMSALRAGKYLVRGLLMLRGHADFLAFVANDPVWQAYRERDPRLLERHFHRYLNAGWNRRQRLLAMRQHYEFVRTAMPARLLEAVYVTGQATLGGLVAKDGSRLSLGLRPPIVRGCEGELTIQLDDASGHPLYRVMLSVLDAGRILAIGCIQGPDGDAARETVRALTRNLHGMRPKSLMLSLACALARQWGCARVLAIGNTAHPLRGVRRRFVADYDAFWLEQQGRAVAGGWYELPVLPVRKLEADVPSAHRSAFRKREALRTEAERILLAAFSPPENARRLHA